jgi:hypothetical protein
MKSGGEVRGLWPGCKNVQRRVSCEEENMSDPWYERPPKGRLLGTVELCFVVFLLIRMKETLCLRSVIYARAHIERVKLVVVLGNQNQNHFCVVTIRIPEGITMSLHGSCGGWRAPRSHSKMLAGEQADGRS